MNPDSFFHSSSLTIVAEEPALLYVLLVMFIKNSQRLGVAELDWRIIGAARLCADALGFRLSRVEGRVPVVVAQ